MATKPHGHDSHPICPTCESDVSGRKGLEYFACEPEAPLTNDNVYSRYEETETLLRCLGALTQAAPLAVANFMEEMRTPPDWLHDLARLAKELTEETQRRLELLRAAGLLWEQRGESMRKEG